MSHYLCYDHLFCFWIIKCLLFIYTVCYFTNKTKQNKKGLSFLFIFFVMVMRWYLIFVLIHKCFCSNIGYINWFTLISSYHVMLFPEWSVITPGRQVAASRPPYCQQKAGRCESLRENNMNWTTASRTNSFSYMLTVEWTLDERHQQLSRTHWAVFHGYSRISRSRSELCQ